MSINASSIVYAYGDQFLEVRRRGGIQLPCSDLRVNKRDLAATALTAALIGLAQGGQARLYVGTRRALLGLRKRSAVFVEPLEGTEPLGGLEGGLLASVSDDQDSNAVRTIVERLLPKSGDPWADVISRIQRGMLGEGYFVEVERDGKVAQFLLGQKLEPNCQRIAALREQVPTVREMVDRFTQANEALHEQLIEDVRRGIRARQEADLDMD